jgi:hypothetical protein
MAPTKGLSIRVAAGALATFVVASSLIACGGGGGDAGTTPMNGSPGVGTLRVALTDAPSCGYDSVKVTVERVRVHQSSTAGDGDAGWSEVVLSPPKQIDLLELTNGVLEPLGQFPLPAGTYTQARLVLVENGAQAPLANAVKPTGESETDLKTPSAQQSGLKIPVDLTVGAYQMVDLVLDFDACKSVVRAGNSGQFILKPVVRATALFLSGVTGAVDATLAGGDTLLSLQQSGVVIKATVPLNDPARPADIGRFLLSPVAPGTYDLVLTAAGRATAVVTGVVVLQDQVATLPTKLSPPGSAMGLVGGSVKITPTPSFFDASVTARQDIAAGHPIEVESHAVASLTGEYSMDLPLAAPVVAPYTTVVLSFSPVTAAGAKYALSAAAAGFAPKPPTDVTLTGGLVTLVDFAFP